MNKVRAEETKRIKKEKQTPNLIVVGVIFMTKFCDDIATNFSIKMKIKITKRAKKNKKTER